MNQEDPIIMYLIVRESLINDMGLGKCCAQVGHAVSMLMIDWHKLDKRYDKYISNIEMYTSASNLIGEPSVLKTPEQEKFLSQYFLWCDWFKEGICKIALKADDKEWEKVLNLDLEKVLVIDAGLTKLEPGTATVIGFAPIRKSTRPKLIKNLQVLQDFI